MGVGFVQATITAHKPVVGIAWIDPDAMVVYVFVFLTGRNKSFAAICAVVHVGIHGKDLVDVFGVTENFLVVVAAC